MLKKTLLLAVAFMGTTATTETETQTLRPWQTKRAWVTKATEIQVKIGSQRHIFPVTEKTTIKDVKDLCAQKLELSQNQLYIDIIVKHRCLCKGKITLDDSALVKKFMYTYNSEDLELTSD